VHVERRIDDRAGVRVLEAGGDQRRFQLGEEGADQTAAQRQTVVRHAAGHREVGFHRPQPVHRAVFRATACGEVARVAQRRRVVVQQVVVERQHDLRGADHVVGTAGLAEGARAAVLLVAPVAFLVVEPDRVRIGVGETRARRQLAGRLGRTRQHGHAAAVSGAQAGGVGRGLELVPGRLDLRAVDDARDAAAAVRVVHLEGRGLRDARRRALRHGVELVALHLDRAPLVAAHHDALGPAAELQRAGELLGRAGDAALGAILHRQDALLLPAAGSRRQRQRGAHQLQEAAAARRGPLLLGTGRELLRHHLGVFRSPLEVRQAAPVTRGLFGSLHRWQVEQSVRGLMSYCSRRRVPSSKRSSSVVQPMSVTNSRGRRRVSG